MIAITARNRLRKNIMQQMPDETRKYAQVQILLLLIKMRRNDF